MRILRKKTISLMLLLTILMSVIMPTIAKANPGDTWTVSFDLNGVTGVEPDTQTINDGGHVTPPAEPKASGWQFVSWHKETTCTDENIFEFEDEQITHDTILYAKWEAKEKIKMSASNRNLDFGEINQGFTEADANAKATTVTFTNEGTDNIGYVTFQIPSDTLPVIVEYFDTTAQIAPGSSWNVTLKPNYSSPLANSPGTYEGAITFVATDGSIYGYTEENSFSVTINCRVVIKGDETPIVSNVVSNLEELQTALNNDSFTEVIVTNAITLPSGTTLDGKGKTVRVEKPYVKEDGILEESPSSGNIFNIESSSNVTIKNMTVMGGQKNSSGAISSNGYLTLENVNVVRSNRGLDDYGGISVLKNCNFSLNVCKSAGAIWCGNGAKLILDGCSFTQNRSNGGSSYGGGAIGVNEGYLYANNTVFANNATEEIGGAINDYNGNVFLMNCTLTGNCSSGNNVYYGGGIGNNGGNFYAVNCIFIDNYSKIINASISRSDISIFTGSNGVVFNCLYSNKRGDGTFSETECKIDESDSVASSYNNSGILLGDGIVSKYFNHPVLTTGTNPFSKYVIMNASGGAATGGINTYFDYSDTSNIKMGYGDDSNITGLGGLGTPASDKKVTTYYEGGSRTSGVIGASRADGEIVTSYNVTVTNDGNGTAEATPTSGTTGTEVTLSATPTDPINYKFKEWQVISGGITITDNKFNIGTSDVEVKAIFEEISSYTVSFMDGEHELFNIQVAKGDHVTRPTTNPEKDDFAFFDWYLDNTLTTKFDFTTAVITKNTSIYAKFIGKITTWAQLQAALSAGGTVVLTQDIVAEPTDTTLGIPRPAVLDLNGYIIDAKGYMAPVIRLSEYSNLVIDDSNPNKEHSPAFTYKNPITNDDVVVNGGIITGGKDGNWGNGIDVPRSTLTINAGSIVGNTTTTGDGAGVFLHSGATCTMNGGLIAGNYTAGSGGGVYLYYSNTFYMTGGSIKHNTADRKGGGVYLWNNQTGYYEELNMSGGSIEENKSTLGGGGVYIDTRGILNVSGNPVIIGNKNGDTDSNVYSGLNVTGQLTDGAMIGITRPYEPGPGDFIVFSNGYGTHNDDDPAKYFVGDYDNIEVVAIENYTGITEAALTLRYSVTVSNDGNGTATANVTSGVQGTEVTLTATPNDSENHRFKEWQVISGGITINDNKFNIGTSNVEVKATFEQIPSHTVTFMDGETELYTQSVKDGNKVTRPTPDPTKEGYTFDGWCADQTLTTTFNFNETSINTDTPIYARWKALPKLVGNSVLRTNSSTATVKFNSNVTGTYYYVATTSSTAMTADSIKSATSGVHSSASVSIGTNTINLTGLSTGAQYIYIVVEQDNTYSNVLTIEMPYDVYYFDDFEAYQENAYISSGALSPISQVHDGTGNANQKVTNSITEGKMLSLSSSSGWASDQIIMWDGMIPTTGKYIFEGDVCTQYSSSETNGWLLRFTLTNGSYGNPNKEAGVHFEKGKVYEATLETTPVKDSFDKDTWYHIKLEFHPEEKLYDIYIDGEKVAEGLTMPSGLNRLAITSGHGYTAYYDNLKYYVDPSYIPTPAVSGNCSYRANASSAKVKFYSRCSGTYYYQVTNSSTAPSADSIKSASTGVYGNAPASAGTNTINLTGLTSGAQYVHILVTNHDNNSNIITIDMPYDVYYFDDLEAYPINQYVSTGAFEPMSQDTNGTGDANQKVIKNSTDGQMLNLTSSSGWAATAIVKWDGMIPTTGKYVIEGDVCPTVSSTETNTWALRFGGYAGSNANEAGFFFDKGKIADRYSENIFKNSFDKNTWYHLKIEFYPGDSLYDVYIDGEKAGEGITLKPGIDRFMISAGHGYTTYFDNLKYYADPNYASTEYDLWIGNKRVNSVNKNNVLGDNKVSFDPTTNTLTLNGATITGGGDETAGYGIRYTGSNKLNIVANGTNVVSDTGTRTTGSAGLLIGGPVGDWYASQIDSDVNITVNEGASLTFNGGTATGGSYPNSYGICFWSGNGNITISGSGTLAVNAGNSMYTYGISTYGELILNSTGTVNITSPDDVYYSMGVDVTEVTINSGTVNVVSGNAELVSQAISTKDMTWREPDRGNITINGGIITATSGTVSSSGGTDEWSKSRSNAIYSEKDIIINGGTVEAKTLATSGDEIYAINKAPTLASGIYAAGSLNSNGSNKVLYNSEDNNSYKHFYTPAEAYTVTFDLNGKEGTAPEERTVLSGSLIPAPDTNPSVTGFKFTGWYKEAGCSNLFEFEIDKITSATTLYAGWQEKQNTTASIIQADIFHGGTVDPTVNVTGSTGAQTIEYKADGADDNTYEITKPTEVGGWIVRLTVAEDDNYKGIVVTSGFHINPVATYTVTFNPNGGTVTPTSKQVSKGGAYGDLPTPNKGESSFVGWFEEIITYGSHQCFNDRGNPVLRITASDTLDDVGRTPTRFNVGDIVSFSVTVNDTTITGIDLNDKLVNSSDYTISADGRTISGKVLITSSNYHYLYDFIDLHLDDYTYSYNINSFNVNKKEVQSTTVYNYDNDTTLYAGWIEAPTFFTVTFNTNGGTAIDSQSVIVGGCATEPAKPTKENYGFGGWYADSTCSTKFKFNEPINADTIVYAKWIAYHDAVLELHDGMNTSEIGDSAEIELVEVVLVERGLLVTEVNGADGTKSVYNQEHKLLFTISEDGKITYAAGIGYKDNIVYELSDVEKATLAARGLYINNLVLSLGFEYKIIEGANQTHTINKDGSLTVKANGDVSKFVELLVDRKKVSEKDYTIVPGSTIATLKKEFLDTLSEGTHELTFVYIDGEVSTNFTIARINQPVGTPASTGGETAAVAGTQVTLLSNIPITGDNVILWVILLVIAVNGFIATEVYIRKLLKK